MTELVADILPWFAAFYLLDAIVQLRRGQVVFNRRFGAGFGIVRTGVQGVALWPTDVALFAHDLPFLPAEEGLYVVDPDARTSMPVVRGESLTLIRWDALGSLRAERSTVRAGRRTVFRARSPFGALVVLGQLTTLRDAAAGTRELEAARMLEKAFDVGSLRARLQKVRRPLAAATAFATAEAVLLFAGLPYVAFVSTAELRWERVLLGLLLAHLGTVVAAAWTLRQSGIGGRASGSILFTLAIFPAYAARAGGQIVRDAFLSWEPSALAAVLLPKVEWLHVVRRECVRLEESVKATEGLGLHAFWIARRRAIDRMLRDMEMKRAEVLAAPLDLAPDVAAWCPLCLGEYRVGGSVCADCGIALDARPPSQPAALRVGT